MEADGPKFLSNILTTEELELTPPQVQEKLKVWIAKFFDDDCKDKAAANILDQYAQKTVSLQSQIQDLEVKLEKQTKNVDELRAQLDSVSAERVQLLEQCNGSERKMTNLRKETNFVVEEPDSLLKIIERQKSQLEQLQDEGDLYGQQLKNAISAKCDAIARVDEIESQKAALDFKEHCMKQERAMLHNQIQTLTDDLKRTTAELQNIRRDDTMQKMHLENRFVEKVEELKISQVQCSQYKETIDQLTQNVQDLSAKLLNRNNEAIEMIDCYKKESEAKTKLADLYKSNCEDNEIQQNELITCITDLKRMVAEATQQYGELETKIKATDLKHEQELEEREKVIEKQKTELVQANELLKQVQQEATETAIWKMAPSASISSRLIRTDMTLTELYSQYIKTFEDLELQKRENSRITLQLKNVLQELGENAPTIKKEEELEYEQLIKTNNILAHQQDELLRKIVEMEEEFENALTKLNHSEREIKTLKQSQSDLSLQVSYLLQEIEQFRMGSVSEGEVAQTVNLLTDDVISKKLVTFRNISELQENNQKLLLLIRDLSCKLEDAETYKVRAETEAWKEKMEAYVEKFQALQDILNQQNSSIATLFSKSERYKKMYFEIRKKYKKGTFEIDLNEDDAMDAANKATNGDSINTSNISKKANDLNKERRIRSLEQQLQDVRDQYKTMKEQYEYNTQEKNNNERIMNEQFDSMRGEVRELTSTNCQLMSKLEHSNEQVKLQQKNIATYKQQINALEDRCKKYKLTIVKHEQTECFLKDEVLKARYGHTASESEASHLRDENRTLKDTVNRLLEEQEGYNREQQSQTLLLNDLEIIKSNLERSEMKGKAQLEQRLYENVRELSAQLRRFQEKEDRFRETAVALKRQTESAIKAMEEEKTEADKLRAELLSVREDITSKTKKNDDVRLKLRESLTPGENDNPIALAKKKAREPELEYEEARLEIDSLNNEVAKVREHAEYNFKMAQNAEVEMKNMHNMHTEYTAKAEAEIKELKLKELNLKSRVSELEAEVKIANIAEIPAASSQSEHIKKTQDEIASLAKKLRECHRELHPLRSQNAALSESLNNVEAKYANEIVSHSVDIQELSKVRNEVAKIQNQIHELITERDSANQLYNDLKQSHEESIRLLQSEKEEQEKRIADLNLLNSSFHDQIEALTMKLSIVSQNQSGNISLCESVMETSGTELYRWGLDDDSKNCSQHLQIIKYLRKEKDLIEAKLDILKAENTRLLSEITILQKKIEELKGLLAQQRSKSQASVYSAAKHEEILRKIETLNAMTGSNRILREERNSMAARVKELNESISKIESELFPQKNQNRELLAKIDELSAENTSLHTEAIKWRQRAIVLVEKSNKNREEFKRLQSERENRAKMLLNQITDESNKQEKLQRDDEIASFEKQIQVLTDEKKNAENDYSALRQNNVRIMQEIIELKNNMLQKEESLQKLTEELESKEAQLQDSKNNEIQIRKIAKRYRDSYMVLSNKTSSTSAEASRTSTCEGMGPGESNTVADGNAAQAATNNKLGQNRITNLKTTMSKSQEETIKIRKEYEDLKAVLDIDGRTKALLREAKARIVSLTEAKNTVSQELTSTKNKLQTFIQTTENTDSAINNIKRQYEETLGRLEKEFLEQSNYSKEAYVRLTRENESLLMCNNQLSRQLGLHQSAKPSTSSVAITDKGCISESSQRTANVKPMSGSTTGQQSATVTPWRDSETLLTSIRPISVQNSRTVAILPTSQQPSSTSSSATTTSTGCSNTAMVPPQQQVHTTGSSAIESMSSSPTSSHRDYMPSTSSASVAVAAIPLMGSTSAAESSQEAESVQKPQQNDTQILCGNSGHQQVVALVPPRGEGFPQNVPSFNLQLQQDHNNQQPSTSGTTSSSTHIAVSSHNRHTPSSSSVTSTQAGTSGGRKRPRELEGDSSINVHVSISDKPHKHLKRLREGETTMLGATELGIDIEYQVPTSSQRDHEDDIIVVDPEEDAEHEGYKDSYEQDQDIDGNEIPEVNASNRADPPHGNPLNSGADIVSSPQGSKFGFTKTTVHFDKNKVAEDKTGDENEVTEEFEKLGNESTSDATKKASTGALADMEEEFADESVAAEISENVDSESYHSSGAMQSEMQNIQENQIKPTSEDSGGADGVSSEGEQQAVEEMEEGREAGISASPSLNTRSKTVKAETVRRPSRGFQRGGRPTPITSQDGSPRNVHPYQLRVRDSRSSSPIRVVRNERSQRARRMRRQTGGSYPNRRYF